MAVPAAFVEGVSLTRRLAEGRSPAELRRDVYLGVYCGRCGSVRQISELSKTLPPLDMDFVGFATRGIERIGAPLPLCEPQTVDGRLRARVNGIVVSVDAEPGGGPCELGFYLYRSPGFIARRGCGDLAGITTRAYLALEPEQSPWFLSRLFEKLRALGQPFAIKTLAQPGAYFRSDAAVVYFHSDRTRDVITTIRAELGASGIRLRNAAPLGARVVAPGLSWAESPLDNEDRSQSFGEVVTDVLIHGSRDEVTVADLAAALREAGRDPAKPHRRAHPSITA